MDKVLDIIIKTSTEDVPVNIRQGRFVYPSFSSWVMGRHQRREGGKKNNKCCSVTAA